MGGGGVPSCVGPACAVEDAGAGGAQSVVDVAVPEAAAAGSSGEEPNELCGPGGTGSCDPDDPVSCPGDAAALGCTVQAGRDGPQATCTPAGTGQTNAPCQSAADCAAGYACVGEGAGQCQPYCCAGNDRCSEHGTYCAERPLYQPSGTQDAAPLSVPVCVAADNCVNLLAPYPCTADRQGTCPCPTETVCTVVRSDATTACVKPGTGQAGEGCPCAPGFVCSESTSTCLRLCDTASAAAPCDVGRCQHSSALPEGFGVCTLDAMGAR